MFFCFPASVFCLHLSASLRLHLFFDFFYLCISVSFVPSSWLLVPSFEFLRFHGTACLSICLLACIWVSDRSFICSTDWLTVWPADWQAYGFWFFVPFWLSSCASVCLRLYLSVCIYPYNCSPACMSFYMSICFSISLLFSLPLSLSLSPFFSPTSTPSLCWALNYGNKPASSSRIYNNGTLYRPTYNHFYHWLIEYKELILPIWRKAFSNSSRYSLLQPLSLSKVHYGPGSFTTVHEHIQSLTSLSICRICKGRMTFCVLHHHDCNESHLGRSKTGVSS